MAILIKCDQCGKVEQFPWYYLDRNRPWYDWLRLHDSRTGDHGEDFDLCSDACLAAWSKKRARPAKAGWPDQD